MDTEGLDLSIPMRCVKETKGFRLVVETTCSDRYTGTLCSIDGSTSNVILEGVIVRRANGKLATLPRCVVRGSVIRVMELPSELKRAAFLQNFVMEEQQAARASRDAKKEAAGAPKKGGSAGHFKRGSAAAKAKKLLMNISSKVGGTAAR